MTSGLRVPSRPFELIKSIVNLIELLLLEAFAHTHLVIWVNLLILCILKLMIEYLRINLIALGAIFLFWLTPDNFSLGRALKAL